MITESQTYPKYKPSGVDWLGDVPKEWDIKRLKCLISTNDNALPEATDPNHEILYVDISNVDPVKGIVGKEAFLFENAPSRARRMVKNGDTIVSTVRTYLRAIAPVVNPEENLIVSTGFAVLRPQKLLPKYLSYILRSPYLVETIVSKSVGVSYPAINASEIGLIKTAVPSNDEQIKIADFLDCETGRIDELIAKKDQLIECLKEKRTALISRAVTKGLNPNVRLKPSGVKWVGDIPEHWEVKKLGYITRCLDGRRVPLNADERGEIQGDIPYWGANGVVDYINKWLFDEELVLLGEDGAPFFEKHKTVSFLVSGRVWVNNHAHILKASASCFQSYLVYSLNITEYGAFIDGSTRDKLTQADMNCIPVVFPPLSEQQAIAEHLDLETGKTDNLIGKVSQAIERLKEYRTALISAAVTGKIDLREGAC